MIKSITPGTGINVIDSHVSWPSFYNSPSSNSLVGQMRYNGSNQSMEVYDGTTWLTMSPTYTTVELSGEVQSIIHWARMKMAEEERLKELAVKHPTVADALEAVKRAEEQVCIVAALVEVK